MSPSSRGRYCIQLSFPSTIAEDEFTAMMALLKVPFIRLSDIIIILGIFLRVTLSPDQLDHLENFYKYQPDIFTHIKESQFLLHILLLVSRGMNHHYDPRSLMMEYAMASGNLFYFDKSYSDCTHYIHLHPPAPTLK